MDRNALVASLRLIAITDNLRDGIEGLTARAGAAVRGGATMVQLRLKDVDTRVLVEAARRLVAELDVPVIVNDRVDVAMVAGAAGVHVGADDMPVDAVRRIARADFIVGASVGNADEAANAERADYAGVGPVFATGSKSDAGDAIGPDGFARLRALVSIPCVGIGGISAANARRVIDAGAIGVAVISSVFGANDAHRAARELRAALPT
ncbi:MAG TPA: thiamine phosphate synthase [Gemmatimonadaceae bacterium]|nr:thiamine phosphate synthase [Gemmatimonadaceae bacterium]